MRDQELFKQLHNLSQMKPDTAWKNSQRSVMLSQLSAGNDVETGETAESSLLLDLFKLPIAYMQGFSQPVLATFLVAFLLLTGGFTGLKASQDTKPGDSLYLAKIVGEKTQLVLAFTDKKKAELGIVFAVRRVEEIKQVIAQEIESGDKDDKVEQLVEDFKKELSAAKLRIEKIAKDDIVETQNIASVHDESDDVETQDLASVQQEEDDQIFSAGSNKTDDGLQVADNSSNDLESDIVEPIVNDTEEMAVEAEATSTEELEISSTSEEVLIEETAAPEDILQQASDLLEAEAYDDILDILNNF